MLYKGKYIGCNHTDLLRFGGINSSFDGTFKDEEILIGSGMDYTPCVIGDISDAYLMLKDEIYKIKPTNINELSECIFNTIQKYFGNYDNVSQRMEFNHDIDEINYGFEIGKVSDLKGKNAAMCVERAMLSQNLLTSLGINTYYKASGINKDKNFEVHAYNIIEYKGKYYIFDTAIPTLINDKINPLICEIPKEVYEQIINPNSDIGYSVSVSHFNPLRNVEVDIIYDSGRENIYNVENSKTL